LTDRRDLQERPKGFTLVKELVNSVFSLSPPMVVFVNETVSLIVPCTEALVLVERVALVLVEK
jgi:hypothetical protein